MQVLIISTNRNNLPAPVLPAGPCLVAEAAERAGHTVHLLDLMFTADPVAAVAGQLKKERYDVIGLSIRNIDNNDMQNTKFYISEITPLVAAIRRLSNAALVLGGASLTVMPREVLQSLGIGSAVVGDGETTFARMLGRMSCFKPCDDLPGVATFRDGVVRVNPSSPDSGRHCNVPNYERWLNLQAYRSQLATVPLQTKLGCRFRCVYCTYRKIEGETYRIFDPAEVADAASRIASSGLRDIEFVDNVFNDPRDHAIGVCEALISANVRARLQSVELNPVSFDEELLAAMERAGFVGIGITAESAADPVLERLRKGFTARHVHLAAEIVRAHRLPCVWIFMLGGPGETEETVKETLLFAERNIRPKDAVFFNIGVRIYPGTELESIARSEGALTKPAGKMLEPVFYMAPGIDITRLQSMVRQALNRHMNYMSMASFSFPFLPFINKLAYRLALPLPLWRHTRFIRRGLRLLGMDA
jgi:radical SAM superfamily enzyme YgiQ (UPF0313 family)